MTLKNINASLQQGQDQSAQTIHDAFAEIFESDLEDDLVRDFLIGLYQKGETKDEVLGAVRYLRSQGKKAECMTKDLIDCCGTGGDQKGTFNISTATAFVLAGAGCHVAKHGNRAVSSQSGSADVLSELGINITSDTHVMTQAIDKIGIGFLFAPSYYPLLKKVGAIRKSLSHRSIFNILGPLLNPAEAQSQLLGVFDQKLVTVMTEVLKELGSKRAVVVHADNGMDEFSLSCVNHVGQLQENGEMIYSVFDPRETGYAFCDESELLGKDPKNNALRLKECLKGHSQALDHTVHINAAWGLLAAGQASEFMDALLIAQQSVSSGKAFHCLERLVDLTNSG